MARRTQGDAAPIVAVGAVVVDDADRVLLIRRARPPSAGSWTLPGGRVEAGEALEAALVRELREETSLQVQIVCPLGPATIERDGRTFVIHEYLATSADGARPRAGDDAAEARWARRDEIDAFGVHADALAVIDRGLLAARRRR